MSDFTHARSTLQALFFSSPYSPCPAVSENTQKKDVNDDGYSDVIISAHGANEAYVFYGAAAFLADVYSLNTLSGTDGFIISTGNDGDEIVVAGVGVRERQAKDRNCEKRASTEYDNDQRTSKCSLSTRRGTWETELCWFDARGVTVVRRRDTNTNDTDPRGNNFERVGEGQQAKQWKTTPRKVQHTLACTGCRICIRRCLVDYD